MEGICLTKKLGDEQVATANMRPIMEKTLSTDQSFDPWMVVE